MCVEAPYPEARSATPREYRRARERVCKGSIYAHDMLNVLPVVVRCGRSVRADRVDQRNVTARRVPVTKNGVLCRAS